MKSFKIVSVIAFVLFLLGIYLGFLYTLSMMTNATSYSFFSDFLDPSVLVFVDQAEATNQAIFKLSLYLVVFSVVLYAFKYKKGNLGYFRYAFGALFGIFAIGINYISMNKLIDLNLLFDVTDTQWPAAFPFPPETFGYVDPGNFFIGSGPTLYLILITVSSLFVLVQLLGVILKVARTKK